MIEGPARFLVNGHNITDSENKSAFAHGVYSLTDKLSFTGGVRYSKDDKNERFDNTIVRSTLDTSDNHVDWKAGVDYKFTDTLLGYVSAATGYRPQSFNPRPFQRTQFVKVDGEEAKSYELGVKAELLERKVRANGAVFYVDYGQRIVGIAGTECNLANPTGTDAPSTRPCRRERRTRCSTRSAIAVSRRTSLRARSSRTSRARSRVRSWNSRSARSSRSRSTRRSEYRSTTIFCPST